MKANNIDKAIKINYSYFWPKVTSLKNDIYWRNSTVQFKKPRMRW